MQVIEPDRDENNRFVYNLTEKQRNELIKWDLEIHRKILNN